MRRRLCTQDLRSGRWAGQAIFARRAAGRRFSLLDRSASRGRTVSVATARVRSTGSSTEPISTRIGVTLPCEGDGTRTRDTATGQDPRTPGYCGMRDETRLKARAQQRHQHLGLLANTVPLDFFRRMYGADHHVWHGEADVSCSQIDEGASGNPLARRRTRELWGLSGLRWVRSRGVGRRSFLS